MISKKNGFTFAEVLLAISLLSFSAYVLSKIQVSKIVETRIDSEKIHRIFFVKKYLYQLYFNPPTSNKPLKIELTNPKLSIVAHKQEIDKKKSMLKDFADDLVIIYSEGTWKRPRTVEKLKMISFVPKSKTVKTNE